jgi:hypothetical protein
MVAGAGCYFAPRIPQLSQKQIEENNWRVFPSPPAKVLNAAIGALRTLGFDIAFENRAAGMIKTARKLIVAVSRSSGYQAAGRVSAATSSVGYHHQYTMRVREIEPGRTRVEVVVTAYRGEEARPLAGVDYWKRRWDELFSQIQDNLS